MSNQYKSNKEHKHKWIVVERKLEDGFQYKYNQCEICHAAKYPSFELQKIFDYKKEHLFLTVTDTIIIILSIGFDYPEYRNHPKKNYIPGITFLQKLLFLFYYENAQNFKIPTENPGFRAYKYGPFSDNIDITIDSLIENKIIFVEGGRKSSQKERFFLSDEGVKRGEVLKKKLTTEQRNALLEFRLFWDEKKLKGLMKYVYSKYKEFTNQSLILKELFPGRKLHRYKG